MAEELKILAQGRLPDTEDSLYPVPGATTAIVKKITIHNTNATTETVIIYLKKSGGSSTVIIYVELATRHTAYDCSAHALGAEADIRGETTTADKVDFTIEGLEFT